MIPSPSIQGDPCIHGLSRTTGSHLSEQPQHHGVPGDPGQVSPSENKKKKKKNWGVRPWPVNLMGCGALDLYCVQARDTGTGRKRERERENERKRKQIILVKRIYLCTLVLPFVFIPSLYPFFFFRFKPALRSRHSGPGEIGLYGMSSRQNNSFLSSLVFFFAIVATQRNMHRYT